MKRTLGIAAALLACVTGVLWFLHDDSPSSTTPAVVSHDLPPPDPAPAEAERGVLPVARPPSGIAAPLPVTAEPTDALVQAMAQRTHERFGPQLVNYLARQGLSRADAEPIVVELLGKTVTCALDALREQALEQRVDFELILNALDAELYDADGPLLGALVDLGAVDRRAMPCSMTALSQAGIPPQAASELFLSRRR